MRRSLPAFAVGSVLLLQMLALWVMFQADESRASFLGHQVGAACSFKMHFGIPCPTCGITRSSVLAAHGEWRRAARINPSGPVAVIGLLTFGVALELLGILQFLRLDAAVLRVGWGIRTGALAYAATGFVVWLGSWISAVAHHE